MDNTQAKREALLTEVMNLFSEVFREKAVLHGGMVLRLLECRRFTNDLDYIFVPFKSKNDVKDRILAALNRIPGIHLSSSMNSKCFRIVIRRDGVTAQVEVKVDTECKTDVLTSAPLSRIHHQVARVISIMDFSVALSNKMSAWLERRLMRDLYDIHLFLNMGIKPDLEILEKRLQKPVYTKGVKPLPGKSPIGTQLFYVFLKDETLKLEEEDTSEALSDILPEEERSGLAMRIKASITSKLI
jgi:predicted nucleotidyltransferase component of viral defense system